LAFTPPDAQSEPGPLLWKQVLAQASEWLLPNSLGSGNGSCSSTAPAPCQKRFYTSAGSGSPLPATIESLDAPSPDIQAAWKWRFLLHYDQALQTSSEPCATDTNVTQYLGILQGSSNLTLGAFLEYSVLSLAGVHANCYNFPPASSMPA